MGWRCVSIVLMCIQCFQIPPSPMKTLPRCDIKLVTKIWQVWCRSRTEREKGRAGWIIGFIIIISIKNWTPGFRSCESCQRENGQPAEKNHKTHPSDIRFSLRRATVTVTNLSNCNTAGCSKRVRCLWKAQTCEPDYNFRPPAETSNHAIIIVAQTWRSVVPHTTVVTGAKLTSSQTAGKQLFAPGCLQMECPGRIRGMRATRNASPRYKFGARFGRAASRCPDRLSGTT